MKAEDLRIGNWIERLFEGESTGTEECTIRTIWDIFKSESEDSKFQFRAIPIPKEWLFAFGFEESDHGFFILMLHDKPRASISINLDYKSCEICQSGLGFSVPCEYVHQLQNLYFALTGEELTVK